MKTQFENNESSSAKLFFSLLCGEKRQHFMYVNINQDLTAESIKEQLIEKVMAIYGVKKTEENLRDFSSIRIVSNGKFLDAYTSDEIKEFIRYGDVLHLIERGVEFFKDKPAQVNHDWDVIPPPLRLCELLQRRTQKMWISVHILESGFPITQNNFFPSFIRSHWKNRFRITLQ